jgi:hypothetical protein
MTVIHRRPRDIPVSLPRTTASRLTTIRKNPKWTTILALALALLVHVFRGRTRQTTYTTTTTKTHRDDVAKELLNQNADEETSSHHHYDPEGYFVFCLCMGRYGKSARATLGNHGSGQGNKPNSRSPALYLV